MGETGIKIKERIELSPLRRIIADRMTESLKTMAQVTLMVESIVDGLVEFRKREGPILEEKAGVKITYTDILIKITSAMLQKHPIMNSSLNGDYIEVYEDINIGLAVATEQGLIVPVIKNVDKKDIIQISREAREMAEKARSGMLTLDDVTGATFTITNLGMFGIDGFTPIINIPNIAVLGVGRIVQKPVFKNEKLDKANISWLSLTFDHRVVDGHTAALFLQDLSKMLESYESVKDGIHGT